MLLAVTLLRSRMRQILLVQFAMCNFICDGLFSVGVRASAMTSMILVFRLSVRFSLMLPAALAAESKHG